MKLNRLFILLLPIISINAHAEGRIGNGGGAMVCRDASGAIQSVQLLDLVEANLQYGFTVNRKNESPDDQVQLASLKLLPNLTLWNKFQDAYKTILANYRPLPQGFGLMPIDDSFPVITPPAGCDFEQVANYDLNGNVLVSSELFQKMSQTDQAALFVHETIYKIDRDYADATNSLHARKIVAYLFGTPSSTDLATTLASLHPVPRLGVWSWIQDGVGNPPSTFKVLSANLTSNSFITSDLVGESGTIQFSYQCDSQWSSCVENNAAYIKVIDSTHMAWACVADSCPENPITWTSTN